MVGPLPGSRKFCWIDGCVKGCYAAQSKPFQPQHTIIRAVSALNRSGSESTTTTLPRDAASTSQPLPQSVNCNSDCIESSPGRMMFLSNSVMR
jgi:hypothetical protein